MKAIHEKKNEDYAAPTNPFENFERSGLLMEWFNDPVDKAFISLIGTKLARLATLLNSKKEPNNESVADSFLDLTTYCGLWSSYREWKGSNSIYPMPDNFKITLPNQGELICTQCKSHITVHREDKFVTCFKCGISYQLSE